ncbi:JAB domain-containing protein [Flavivirga aquatica]|uniref:JAB domain-containing protein n=1 Tax=Flavivirga aquatica TaxID=1849968 RepID=UPI001F0B63AA|nr:JAB domain-containing protein [Flavivirga aquatica]
MTEKTKIKIQDADDIYGVMQRILLREQKVDRGREHFWTISLDNANKILNIELVSMGSFKATIVEPMEVFSIPLQKRAVKLILVHNHPSGTLKPSEADKDITDHMIQVGRIMKVPVLEHLIITESTCYSFAATGLLKELEASTKYVPAFELKRRFEKAALDKGKEEGVKQGKKEMAKIMKVNREPIEKIIEYTGLTKVVINKLK